MSAGWVACADLAPTLRDCGLFLFSRRGDSLATLSYPTSCPTGRSVQGSPLSVEQHGAIPDKQWYLPVAEPLGGCLLTTLPRRCFSAPSPEAWRLCATRGSPACVCRLSLATRLPPAGGRSGGSPVGHSPVLEPNSPPPLGDDPPVGCPRLRVGAGSRDPLCGFTHPGLRGPALSSRWGLGRPRGRTSSRGQHPFRQSENPRNR